MIIFFRNTFDLMDYAAQRYDLTPEQRKELYRILEDKNTLKTSKDPGKDASKLAEQIAKKTKKAKSEQSTKAFDATQKRSAAARLIDEEDEEEGDGYEDYSYDMVIDDTDEEN